MHFSSVEPSAVREIFLSEPLNMVICPINQCKEPEFQNQIYGLCTRLRFGCAWHFVQYWLMKML